MKPFVREIILATSEAFGADPVELVWPDHQPRLNMARNAVFLVARKTGHSHNEIAKFMGRRIPETIRNGADRCEDLMAENPAYHRTVSGLLASFWGAGE